MKVLTSAGIYSCSVAHNVKTTFTIQFLTMVQLYKRWKFLHGKYRSFFSKQRFHENKTFKTWDKSLLFTLC